jgi:hypothetical protein
MCNVVLLVSILLDFYSMLCLASVCLRYVDISFTELDSYY